MRIPGRRLFLAACIVLLLFGGTHLIAVWHDNFVTPTDSLQIEAERAMSAVKFDIGPFHTHAAMLVQLLSASYAVLLLALGAVNLIAMKPCIANRRFRALTIANLIFVGLLLALTVIYQFPPPMLFAATAEILLIASLIRQSAKPLAA